MNTIKITKYRDLIVWQKADLTFLMIYKDSLRFPRNKVASSITDQVIKSVSSISANIAEGYAKGGNKEFARYLKIARGSLAESDNWIHKIHQLDWITNERTEDYYNLFEEINKMINSLIFKLNNS